MQFSVEDATEWCKMAIVKRQFFEFPTSSPEVLVMMVMHTHIRCKYSAYVIVRLGTMKWDANGCGFSNQRKNKARFLTINCWSHWMPKPLLVDWVVKMCTSSSIPANNFSGQLFLVHQFSILPVLIVHINNIIGRCRRFSCLHRFDQPIN